MAADTTKAELVKQAEQIGVPTDGTKADIAARLDAAQTNGRLDCPDCPFHTSVGPSVLAAHRRSRHRKEIK